MDKHTKSVGLDAHISAGHFEGGQTYNAYKKHKDSEEEKIGQTDEGRYRSCLLEFKCQRWDAIICCITKAK